MAEHQPIPKETREPRLYGVIDVLRTDRVAGWVIDRTDASRTATVEIYCEGRCIGTVKADRPRKDLERQSVGTGAYGFVFPLEPPIEEGMEFTISVTAQSYDGVKLQLSPAARAAATVSAEKRALGRILAEISELRQEIGGLKTAVVSAEESSARFQDRLEHVQLRLEHGIASSDTPKPHAPGWLAAVAISGGILAAGSMILALLSLW